MQDTEVSVNFFIVNVVSNYIGMFFLSLSYHTVPLVILIGVFSFFYKPVSAYIRRSRRLVRLSDRDVS